MFLDSLDVGALITDGLLHHLETSGAELPGDHLLAAVALPRALGRLHDWLVAGQLDKVADVELLERDPEVHDHVGSARHLLLAVVVAAAEEAEVTPEERGEGVAATPAALETKFDPIRS